VGRHRRGRHGARRMPVLQRAGIASPGCCSSVVIVAAIAGLRACRVARCAILCFSARP
jgi:hypothetical protein